MIRTGIFAGSSIKVTVRFKDPDTGVLVDVGSTVDVEVRPPATDAGVERDLIVTSASAVSTGVYVGSFLAEWAGRYSVRATSTGPDPAVALEEVEVRSADI